MRRRSLERKCSRRRRQRLQLHPHQHLRHAATSAWRRIMANRSNSAPPKEVPMLRQKVAWLWWRCAARKRASNRSNATGKIWSRKKEEAALLEGTEFRASLSALTTTVNVARSRGNPIVIHLSPSRIMRGISLRQMSRIYGKIKPEFRWQFISL